MTNERVGLMGFADELNKAADDIMAKPFDERNGRVVPATIDIAFNGAVKMTATFLYADMVDSSGLVNACRPSTVGKVLRLYLDLSVRIIKKNGGVIKSFDGDRVMAVFIGHQAVDRAALAAMQISWACSRIIQSRLDKRYQSIVKAKWRLKPASGIATGEALFVRGGVRRGSDLVAVGLAPNLAAKLSDIRRPAAAVRIDQETYKQLLRTPRASTDMQPVWEGPRTLTMGGRGHTYYRSNHAISL